MTDFLTPFYDGIAKLASIVWPEAAVHGVFHAMDLKTESFEKSAKAGKIPAVAMDYALRVTHDFGRRTRAERGPVTLYYVVSNEGGVEVAIRKGQAMREYIWENGLPYGRNFGYPDLLFDMTLPANAYFLNGNKPFVAAAVVIECMVGAIPGA